MVTHQSYAVVASEHPLAKEKEVTFVQLAKCGYGIALLPGFVSQKKKQEL